MAERQLGPFVLGEKLGGGGMGVVYRARYTKTGQNVALKILPASMSDQPRMVARFERELEILKKLRHPNIVPCFGGGKIGNQHYFTMELVEGGSLTDELKKRGRIPWEETIGYGLQICAALEHAHDKGIVHRDLKPSNLLLTKDGKIKLADFGIARDLDATGLTATGKTVGTFHYMAPEQIRGEPPVSHKTDLYALGCVLYELLTGRPPFNAETQPELMFQHLEKKPARLTSEALDCPVWLETLVNQLLEKHPLSRPRDASTVALALREVEQKVAERRSLAQHAVSGQPTAIAVTGETSVVRGLLKKKKRRKKDTGPFYEQTWFLAGCLIAALALVAWSLWPMSEDRLYAHAKQLMDSADPIDWDRANDKYLAALQSRFPGGRYAEQVQAWIDKLEMHKAEERIRFNNRLGREPASEGERLYGQARQYEQFGDRVTALEHYEAMIRLLESTPDARPYVNLARRQKAQIESSGSGQQERIDLIAAALAKADELHASGNVIEARKKWNDIISLYGNNRELEPQVQQARSRLAGNREPAQQSPRMNERLPVPGPHRSPM
jgi:eukaryotic-like serine/threonine-protein kinase